METLTRGTGAGRWPPVVTLARETLCQSLAAGRDAHGRDGSRSLAAGSDVRALTLCQSLAAGRDARGRDGSRSLAAGSDVRALTLCQSLAVGGDAPGRDGVPVR